MKTIPSKCYIVANMPDEVSHWVTELRKKVDPVLVHMPVEVTLSGSSGVGPLVEGQDFERIKTILTECVSKFVPFEFTFKSIDRFPSTEIYFLDPEPDVFRVIHKKLVESDLEFEKQKFPFSPHCSVAGFTPITDESRSIITSADFPRERHIVSSISIYKNENMNPVELWRYDHNETCSQQSASVNADKLRRLS